MLANRIANETIAVAVAINYVQACLALFGDAVVVVVQSYSQVC